jgi:hypothetical protein
MTELAYNKPEAPGISLNFDNSVSIYYVVDERETFEQAARGVLELVRQAQQNFPAWPRAFYLDIEGHTLPDGRLDEDFVEFQQEFLFSVVGPFVSAMDTPLTGGVLNPEPQRNDVPDRLRIE